MSTLWRRLVREGLRPDPDLWEVAVCAGADREMAIPGANN